MVDENKLKAVLAYIKIYDGEELTVTDFSRFISVLETRRINFGAATPEAVAGLQARLKAVLQDYTKG